MPRLMRRAKLRRVRSAESKRVVKILLTGHDFPFLDPAAGDVVPEATLREAWEELREEVIAEWVDESPGTRPWAWWSFDAPEPRRRRIGTSRRKPGRTGATFDHQVAYDDYEFDPRDTVHPFDRPARQAHVAKWAAEYPKQASTANRLTFGTPSSWVGYEVRGSDGTPVLCWDDAEAIYETEADYLARHKLLSREERAAMERTRAVQCGL